MMKLILATTAMGALLFGGAMTASATSSSDRIAPLTEESLILETDGVTTAAAAAPTCPSGVTTKMCNVVKKAKTWAADHDAKWRGLGCVRTGGDHGAGRACDFAYATIGKFPTAANKSKGDKLRKWLWDNRAGLKINYVIWQGTTWSGNHPSGNKNSGGLDCRYDANVGRPPSSNADQIRLCHYDHIHVSVKP